MNILVPLPDFVDSSAVFRDVDLKQQANNISITMDALHEVSHIHLSTSPWAAMWRGHEVMLCEYGITLVEEHISRTESEELVSVLDNLRWHLDNASTGEFSMDKPAWFGDTRVHDSHKSLLLRLDKFWYRQHFGDIDSELDLYFP